MVCRFRVPLPCGPVLFLAAFCAAYGLAAEPARPAEPDGNPAAGIFDWLYGEPMTLMDAGVIRLRQDLSGATRFAAMHNRDLRGWHSGVYYSRRQTRVIAYVTVVAAAGADRTQRLCSRLFHTVLKALMIHGPEGPGKASWYLEQTFGHQGAAWSYGQPRDLGEVLSERVYLRISLLPPDFDLMNAGARRAACEGPLGGKPQKLAELAR